MIYGAFLHQFFPSIIQKTPLFELCLVTHQTVLLSSVSEATMARGNCKFFNSFLWAHPVVVEYFFVLSIQNFESAQR